MDFAPPPLMFGGGPPKPKKPERNRAAEFKKSDADPRSKRAQVQQARQSQARKVRQTNQRQTLGDVVPDQQLSTFAHPVQPMNTEDEPPIRPEPPPDDDDVAQLTPGGAQDIDVEESESANPRATPGEQEEARETQESDDEEQGVTAIKEDDETAEYDPAQNEDDADVDRLAAKLEQETQVTTDADRKREAKEREKADKQRETPQKIDEDKEGDAETRKIQKLAEAERKKMDKSVSEMENLMKKLDVNDPAEKKRIADELREQARRNEAFWDGYGVEDMDVDEGTFYDEDGNFDEEKYDLYRDLVVESYDQQLKKLKAAVRLLKRLRKDKTRVELPQRPGWQYLPGDRRIWTDPHAVAAEVAYPKTEGFVSQGGPQSVFGFGT